MPYRLLLSIDDVGDVLALVGTSCQVGHAVSQEPELAFLGDIDPLHGTLRLQDSFHGGAEWGLQVRRGAPPIEVDGATWSSEHGLRTLYHGDHVRFGEAASFTCRRSDPSSATMILELEGRTDAEGARRVALLAPGVGGRLRMGPRLRRQLVVPSIATDVALVAQLDMASTPTLTVSCDAGVRLLGPYGVPPGKEVILPLPLEDRMNLAFGAAPDRLPPFGMALRPTPRRSGTR